MNCTEEIVQLTNDMRKEFNEFGEVTFETKQKLNEICYCGRNWGDRL